MTAPSARTKRRLESTSMAAGLTSESAPSVPARFSMSPNVVMQSGADAPSTGILHQFAEFRAEDAAIRRLRPLV